MIVIAIIAVIAAIAIPGLLRSRSHSNETSAIGSLKVITSGLEQFRNSCSVDLNTNGLGEFGYLEELSGLGNYRINNTGGTGNMNAHASPWISTVFGNTDANGCASKSGYLFVIYLPTGPNGATCIYPTAVNLGLAEKSFILYGFPNVIGKSGVRVFAVNQVLMIYGWGNSQSTYAGSGNAPPWNASLGDTNGDGGIDWTDNIDEKGQGQAGVANNNWVPIG
jgi:type II secretory pathway pseudopilin PulG